MNFSFFIEEACLDKDRLLRYDSKLFCPEILVCIFGELFEDSTKLTYEMF